MSVVKKSALFKKPALAPKRRAALQKYLNQMSKNGLHLERIGKLKYVFTEDASIRFIYAVCGEWGKTLYSESGEWENFLTVKNVTFFRKSVPADAVSIERKFGKKQQALEKNWLTARLAEGLCLIGRVENEYVFRREGEYGSYEYHIKTADLKKCKKNNTDPTDSLGGIRGLTFVTASSDGTTYYFLKDAKIKNSVTENRGKRLSDQALAVFIATGSAFAFCACVALTIFGAIKSLTLWLTAGAIGIVAFAISFIFFFKRSQKIAEIRKIRAEERRARLEAERLAAQSAEEQASSASNTASADTTNNNTVVMNTVVLNNYGKDGQGAQNIPFDGINNMGAIFDPAQNPALDPRTNPALDPAHNPALNAVQNPAQLASSVMSSPYSAQPLQADGSVYQSPGFKISESYRDFEPQQTSTYTEDEWVAPEQIPENEEYYDSEEQYDDDCYYEEGFPILPFIGYALLCLACVVAFCLSIKFTASWFGESGKNVLLLVLSFFGIGFSPFLFWLGFSNCRRILVESPVDDDEQYDYEDEYYDEYDEQ